MTASAMAKRVQLLTVIFVSAALPLRLGLTNFDPDRAPDDPNLLTRTIHFFSYFTIQSNIVVLSKAQAKRILEARIAAF